ncbi:hypothetical protein BU23DRAFT_561468 [Bimuria novae-zelandiae CBS 107.79]|uniref:BTB domain-containing protein n=1 Tax=Bimuria novae-zelandiae CBS 107.79 TaxID=1447943 RepID=A0A6A5UJ26_9PLEO|nr:hypothetical protein BU23DRAFT_561468 [Bimuria novae-zelandiae CBS 107.79]
MSSGKVTKKKSGPTVAEIFLSRTVTIKIGPARRGKEYQVHKAAIVHHSEFFRAAFEAQNFKEGVSDKITLNDVDPTTFEALIDWLYRQDLPEIKQRNWTKYGGSKEDTDIYVTRLYVLADRFIMPKLKQLALEIAFTEFDEYVWPALNTIKFAFESLPEGDPFLQLLVDQHCLYYDGGGFYNRYELETQECFGKLPGGFLVGVMRRYAEMVKKERRLRFEDYLRDDDDDGLETCG